MTVDANIIIAYLAGEESVIEFLSKGRQMGNPLFLATVVETEVLSFSGWTAEERRATELFLEEGFTSVAFDRIIARLAADIRQQTRIKFPDAAIAATALFTHTPLITRNQRDFKNIKGLTILPI